MIALALLAPTTRVSSSLVARRTPDKTAKRVSSAFRRRGPMPGTASSSDRKSRLVRDWR